jgi:hypothetical protein
MQRNVRCFDICDHNSDGRHYVLFYRTDCGSDNGQWVRLRYRIVARHYRELAEREEKADKARMADRLEQLRMQRQKPAASQTTLSAQTVTPQSFLIAAE